MNIEDHSRVELEAMLEYVETRGGDKPPVLIGGWAVHALCGPNYLRSIDIDFVLKSRDRDSLIHWVVENRGFGRVRDMTAGWKGATKPVPELGQDIILDTASYEMPNVFHARDEVLPFSLVADHHTTTDVYGRQVRIPTRSLMLLYKAKAAFDRAARLSDGSDEDPTYTRAKLVKDRSDIIALLQNRDDWELRFLHEEFGRLPFLLEVVDIAVADHAALERSGVSGSDAASAWARLRQQIGH